MILVIVPVDAKMKSILLGFLFWGLSWPRKTCWSSVGECCGDLQAQVSQERENGVSSVLVGWAFNRPCVSAYKPRGLDQLYVTVPPPQDKRSRGGELHFFQVGVETLDGFLKGGRTVGGKRWKVNTKCDDWRDGS